MGIIYLIQPAELVGTNRVKIGCSTKSNLDRIKNGYKNGTKYICIQECYEPFKIEKKLKDVFLNNFNLIAGKEYFEGSIKEIKIKFMEVLLDELKNELVYENNPEYIKFIKLVNELENCEGKRFIMEYEKRTYEKFVKKFGILDDYELDEFIDKINNVYEKFPKYYEDKAFGGDNKLVIINDSSSKYHYSVDTFMIDDNLELFEHNFSSEYSEHILMKKILKKIKIDKCYYLNSIFEKTKKIKTIINDVSLKYDDFKDSPFNVQIKDNNTWEDYFNATFLCDIIINNNIYIGSELNFNVKSDNYEKFSIPQRSGFIHLYKYSSKYYFGSQLRKSIPYYIDFDKEGNYALGNRDYEYFEGFCDDKPKSRSIKLKSCIHLFNDGSAPWYGYDKLKNVVEKYKEILSENNLTNCLNKECEAWNDIINIF